MAGSLINTADAAEAGIRADQAKAEAGAGRWAAYYEANPGVPVESADGHAPQPLPVSGDAAVTGVPWDAQ